MGAIRLIVNADDFGFTRDVNEGIVEAHRNGILTSTTLMANGDAFDHAVALARGTPSLDVGCHLVLDVPVYEKFAAQVRKMIAAGIVPTHLDTHKHRHLLPPVQNAMWRVAREFGIRWVRQRLLWPNAPAGLRMTDHFTGFRTTGSLDTQSLVHALAHLPEGLTEFMCHPGKLGAELQKAPTRLKESREIELAALTSREVRDVIERRGIQLVNFSSA